MTQINTSSPQYSGLVVWLPTRDGTGTTWHEFLSNGGAGTDIAIDGAHNTWSAESVIGFGTVLNFDRTGAARVATGLTTGLNSTFSYAAWVRLHTNVSPDSSYVCSEDNGGVGKNIGVNWSGNGWFMYSHGVFPSSVLPTLDAWVHVVATQSGTVEELYINGSFVSNNTAGFNNGGTLYVGGYPGYDPGTIDGSIGDFRVYDHVLSASEVSAMYDVATRFDLYLSPTSIPVFMNQFRARRA